MTRSRFMHAASIDLRFRADWYSGSDLPAWRMNQTGVWATDWRRQARRKGDSLVGAVTQVIISQPGGTRRRRSTAWGRRRATIVSSRAPLPRAPRRSPEHLFGAPGGEGGHGNEPDVPPVQRVRRRAVVRPAPRHTGQLPRFAGR